MSWTFLLSAESTVDVPYSYVQKRKIPVLEYSYIVDGKQYPDDMGRDPSTMDRFYKMLESGVIPSTSQLTEFQYTEYFENLLKEADVLHIAFGSGMTASVGHAISAAEKLREKYPGRQILVIDSTCSSSGYGLLVDYAADIRDNGASLEETAAWVEAHKQHVHHQFFSTTLSYYRRSGRMSGPAAAIGTVLNICPIMRLDDGGHIIAYDKVRGRKKAIARTMDEMEKHAEGGKNYAQKCWVCHSNCLETAEVVRDALRQRFPNIQGDIRICDIGTIIASHCGPGTVAVFFLGDARASEDKNR